MTAITLSPRHVGMELAGAVARIAEAMLVCVAKSGPASRAFIRSQNLPVVSASRAISLRGLDWLAEMSTEANKVRAFCEEQKIVSALVVAVEMAKKAFPDG